MKNIENKLILEKNSIDHRWKVLSNGFTIGDGKSPEDAIASARMLTNEPIFEYCIHDGQYHQVISESDLAEENFIANGENHYAKTCIGDDL